MTRQQPSSRGSHYSQSTENKEKKKHRKTKNTFLLSSILSSHLWGSSGANLLCFLSLCSTTQMKMVGEKWGSLRWRERIERERWSAGAAFKQTAEREKWNILLMCCLQYNLSLMPNIPQSVYVCVCEPCICVSAWRGPIKSPMLTYEWTHFAANGREW